MAIKDRGWSPAARPRRDPVSRQTRLPRCWTRTCDHSHRVPASWACWPAAAGPPTDAEYTDYGRGGCPRAIEEDIEILRLYDEQCDQKLPRMHVVFGAYDGPIDAKEGEKVIFIGDCATWQGQLGDKTISVENLYRDRSTKDPHHARHQDIYAKMLEVTKQLHDARHDQHVRFTGCPVSVAEQVLFLCSLGGVKNPYFDSNQIVLFNKGYLGWRAAMALKRVKGVPYQIAGPCDRGAAKPELPAPAE